MIKSILLFFTLFGALFAVSQSNVLGQSTAPSRPATAVSPSPAVTVPDGAPATGRGL